MSDYTILALKEEARKKLAAGADKLASAVVSTLGPRSRNVAINQQYPGPRVIHDGVTVARAVRLQDPFEDMGAVLLMEASTKANELAGDGTTTATLIANTLLQEGMKITSGNLVDGLMVGKVNPMKLREELEKYAQHISTLLSNEVIKIDKKEEFGKVAQISAGLPEIAEIVTEAIDKVGAKGVVLVETTGAPDSYLEQKEGYEFDNGLLSPFFVTDPDRMICEYTDGYILITDHFITDAVPLGALVDEIAKKEGNKPLLIIAGDVQGPALVALNKTRLQLAKQLVAVKAPGFADSQRNQLDDIALVTGGNVISSQLKKPLSEVKISDLGRFERLRVTPTHTAIVPKNPDSEEVNERLSNLKEQLSKEENKVRRYHLEERIQRLSQNLVTLYVGGGTDVQGDERKERAIDAVNATKAALEEGVIPGGGTTLYRIADQLLAQGSYDDPILMLVVKALQAPFLKLMENSGIEVTEEDALNQIVNNKRIMDVVNVRWAALSDSFIVDPLKVTRTAVTRAFDVAAMMLTTDTLISQDVERDRNVQLVKPV